MNLFLKLSVLVLVFTFFSCKKAVNGVSLPNLENTTWSGNVNGNPTELKFDFQKNGNMKIKATYFGVDDTIGTWQVKEFTFLAKFTDRSNRTWIFEAPISTTKLKGTVIADMAASGYLFSVQKQ